MESATIDYADDGRRHSLKVGDLIDIEIEDFVPPQLLPDGDVEMLTGVFHLHEKHARQVMTPAPAWRMSGARFTSVDTSTGQLAAMASTTALPKFSVWDVSAHTSVAAKASRWSRP